MMTIRRVGCCYAQPTTLDGLSLCGRPCRYIQDFSNTYSFNTRFAATLSCRAGSLSLIGMLKASETGH
jgi:hypothetical protein